MMEPLKRHGIDDILPINSHVLAHAVRSLDALKKVSAALDHVINHAKEEVERWGVMSPMDSEVYKGDLDEAHKWSNILMHAHDAAEELIRLVEVQFPDAIKKVDKMKAPPLPKPVPASPSKTVSVETGPILPPSKPAIKVTAGEAVKFGPDEGPR